LPSLTSASPASEFSNNIVSTVSDFVAGLHRINARRAQNQMAKASSTVDSSAGADRPESSIPNLSAGFGYAAWRS
jgi:hypothetical protein